MGRPRTLHESLPGLWRVLLRFAPYLRSQRGLLAGSLVALLAETGLRLLEPWPLKLVFDRVLVHSHHAARIGLGALDALEPTTLLAVSAVAVAAIAGLRALAAYANTVGFALVGNHVLTEVRSELFRHLHRLSLSFHTRARGGDLVVRVIGDVGYLKDVTVTAVVPLLVDLLILLGMVGLMFWIDWRLTALVLSIAPPFWLAMVRLSRRMRDVAHIQRRREGAMAAAAAESIGAMKVVHSLSLEGAFASVFAVESSGSLKEGAKASRLAARLERTVDLLTAVAAALVLWTGARFVIRGSLTPGDLLVFLAYLRAAFRPMKDFAKYTGRLAKAAAAGERILDLLEREPDVRDLPGAVPAPAFRGRVRFEHVSFAYEPGHVALHDIELEAHPGERIAIVGPSGCGKSTLIGLLLRLYDPQRGRVTIDGRDIRDYTLASLRAQISVVLQDTILFAASVRENIAYGAPAVRQEEIEAAARLAAAHDFIQRMPDGYDTVLGERGVTLSTGQRQRIAVARAAVRRSPILILDEPTTGLDWEHERALVEALDRLAEGRTTFLVTHNLQHAATADRVLRLDGGRVIECGPPAAVLPAAGRRAEPQRVAAAMQGQRRQQHGGD